MRWQGTPLVVVGDYKCEPVGNLLCVGLYNDNNNNNTI